MKVEVRGSVEPTVEGGSLQKEGVVMLFTMKSFPSSKSQSLPIEIKVQAVADVVLHGASAMKAAVRAYESAGRKVPKGYSQAVRGWYKSIQKQIAAENQTVINLCQKAGLEEESKPTTQQVSSPAKPTAKVAQPVEVKAPVKAAKSA